MSVRPSQERRVSVARLGLGAQQAEPPEQRERRAPLREEHSVQRAQPVSRVRAQLRCVTAPPEYAEWPDALLADGQQGRGL